MRNPLKAKDPIARLEDQLSDSRKRLAELQRGLENAREDAKAASDVRMALLVDGDEPIGSAAMAKATEACRTAESNVAGVEGAIRVVEARIREAEENIAGTRDRNERARLADKVEARAAEIEKAAADLDGVAQTFASKRAKLFDVLSRAGLGAAREPIVQAAIRLAAPGSLPSNSFDHFGIALAPIGAVSAAAASQVGPLRAAAAGIRSGALPAVEPSAPPAPLMHIPIGDKTVVLKESICFFGIDGGPVLLNEGSGCIAAPVADAAIARGLGFLPDSEGGMAILRELKKGQAIVHRDPNVHAIVRRGPPYTDLGFSLRDYVASERARLTANTQTVGV